MPGRGKRGKPPGGFPLFPPPLEIARGDFHIPTAPATRRAFPPAKRQSLDDAGLFRHHQDSSVASLRFGTLKVIGFAQESVIGFAGIRIVTDRASVRVFNVPFG